MKKILFICILAACYSCVYAQRTDRSFVRKGNRLFEDSLFIKAEENYLKAVDMNPELYEGNFNLGNAYTAQQKPNEAVDQYRKTANALEARKKELTESGATNSKELESCMTDLAKTYHNTGVVYHMSERYDKAVEAYKQALRNNPHDDETRYNLAMAQHQLKKNQDQQQNGGGSNDDKNKDKQDQDKQQQQQKQDQQKQDQQKKDEEKQKQQQQPQPEQKKDEMSDQVAEQLLNSAQQDEKGVQRKVNKNQNNKRRSLEKDW